MTNLQILDKDAKTWFVNTAAFRMHDPSTGHIFEPGTKYQVHESEWMSEQPTIEATDMDEEVDHKVRKPTKPSSPPVDRNKD